MKRIWVGVTVALAALAACGVGNAIVNVDVFSFLQGSSSDSIPYVVPPGASNFAVSNAPRKINLIPGVGGSLVDTVSVSGSTNFVNQTGTGSIGFQLYVASDSAATYQPSAAVFAAPLAVNVTPGTTTPLVIPLTNLTATLDSLFSQSAIWVRLVAVVSNSGATLVQGVTVLTGLNLRVVVNVKTF